MKITQIILLLAGLVVTGVSKGAAQAQSSTLVAHEWGTFTSFQGGDGKLLSWKSLETSKLPKFVYDWKNPGLDRQTASMMLVGGKGGLTSLQRMETPVIYFYSTKKENVDVSVDFPDGLITEWYPQATQIGPASLAEKSLYATWAQSPALAQSRIHWANVEISSGPAIAATSQVPVLATDDSGGSHYFAARSTESDLLTVDSYSQKTPKSESEKFLFYRGVGNFKTPLHVVMKSDDGVDLANTGDAPLSYLFVLVVKRNAGQFVYVPEIPAGGVKVVTVNGGSEFVPLDKLSENLGREMSAALAKTGLYPREATAMVNTWKDSWFSEPGVRVLYVLPRAWTDHTLPMTLNPAPKELVRTMVGRAEVFPPGQEHNLAGLLEKVRHGDAQASTEASELLKQLGRFAEPAFGRVLSALNPRPDEIDSLNAVFNQARNPNNRDTLSIK